MPYHDNFYLQYATFRDACYFLAHIIICLKQGIWDQGIVHEHELIWFENIISLLFKYQYSNNIVLSYIKYLTFAAQLFNLHMKYSGPQYF